jgi:glycosyltransferase involved in cell wall biosynthesis
VTRPRVLWVVKGLGPGGTERLLASLAATHDRARVDLRCAYVHPWKNHLVAELEADGVEVHCLGEGGGTRWRWIPRLRSLVTRWRPDIVHFHSPLLAGLSRPALPGGATRPLTVVTEHNAWGTFSPPTRALNALAFRRHRAVLAVSEETRASIPARWRDRVELLVHGVALDDLRRRRAERDATRAELGIGPDEVAITTVANFRAQKDYPSLLRAARQVIDAGVPVRFLAVGQGDGPVRDKVLELHRQLGLGERFSLLGFRDDVPAVLAASDVFCLSSVYEGYPVALMEALAIGVPVVATAVGGVADAIRDGVEGRLVSPGDPGALAIALIEVAKDADGRAAMARAAAERAELFDIRRAAQRLEDLYAEVVTNSS